MWGYQGSSYEFLLDLAINYAKTHSVDPYYWLNLINLEYLVRSDSLRLSPVALIIVGLHPIVASLCSNEVGKELATSLNEDVRKLSINLSAGIPAVQATSLNLKYMLPKASRESRDYRRLQIRNVWIRLR